MNGAQTTHPRRRTRAEAAALVAEYEASGLTRREFCSQHELSLNTLNRYCARRRAGAQPAGGEHWVEVEIRGSAAADGDLGKLWLHLAGGRRIEVRRGFDLATLQQLLRVLERA